MFEFAALKIIGSSIKVGPVTLNIPEQGRQPNSKLNEVKIKDSKDLLDSFGKVGGDSADIERGGLLQAFYDPRSEVIYLSADLNKNGNSNQVQFGGDTTNNTFQGRFLHEYAYHIWYHGLSQSEQHEWNKIIIQ